MCGLFCFSSDVIFGERIRTVVLAAAAQYTRGHVQILGSRPGLPTIVPPPAHQTTVNRSQLSDNNQDTAPWLHPVYTIEQTSSRHPTIIEQTSSWLFQLTYSQLVEPFVEPCKRGIRKQGPYTACRRWPLLRQLISLTIWSIAAQLDYEGRFAKSFEQAYEFCCVGSHN